MKSSTYHPKSGQKIVKDGVHESGVRISSGKRSTRLEGSACGTPNRSHESSDSKKRVESMPNDT